jgi:hypothetical protein
MAKLEMRIGPCGGGDVQFGLQGNTVSVYLRKFQLCMSAFQDERYGRGNRVHNAQGGKNEGQFRCTVCGMGRGIVRP